MLELMYVALLISGDMVDDAIMMDRFMPQPSLNSAPENKFGAGEFVVELEDEQGHVFYEKYFSTRPSDYSNGRFRVVIPDVEETVSINFRRRSDEHLLYRYAFDDSVLPEIEFIKLPPPIVEEDFDVEFLMKSDDLVIEQENLPTWWVSWLEVSSTEGKKAWKSLPTGDCALELIEGGIHVKCPVVSDRLYYSDPAHKLRAAFYLHEADPTRTVNYMYEEVEGTFYVPPKPIVATVGPGEGYSYTEHYFRARGAVIGSHFIGPDGKSEREFEVTGRSRNVGYIEDEDMTWYSSKDGIIGHGRWFKSSGDGSLLSPGFHEISVELKSKAGQLHTEHVTNITVIDERPMITVRQGDGSEEGLNCNELEVDVDYGYDLIKYVRYGFDIQSNQVTQVPNLTSFPVRYQMTDVTDVYVYAKTTIGYTSNFRRDFYPLECPEP